MNVEISKVTTKTRVKGYIIHELNGKNGKMEKILIQKTKNGEKKNRIGNKTRGKKLQI